MKITQRENQITYDLELEKAITEIKETKAKTVLIQLAEGLKPMATKIVDELERKTNAQLFIWAGSCFGACDLPPTDQFDLLIQFGHSKWPFWK